VSLKRENPDLRKADFWRSETGENGSLELICPVLFLYFFSPFVLHIENVHNAVT
jgi:hypothetical protein